MTKKFLRSLSSVIVAGTITLSACSAEGKPMDSTVSGRSLTLTDWNEYSEFLSLLGESCPDIEADVIPYSGANRTEYGWIQLRADDIPDIFITSQIVDGQSASEHLADLSGYDFINIFPTSVLDQISVDGGIYLLPVNYAMYGILYNKTLMNEKGWDVPTNFAELEALCTEIQMRTAFPTAMRLLSVLTPQVLPQTEHPIPSVLLCST